MMQLFSPVGVQILLTEHRVGYFLESHKCYVVQSHQGTTKHVGLKESKVAKYLMDIWTLIVPHLPHVHMELQSYHILQDILHLRSHGLL